MSQLSISAGMLYWFPMTLEEFQKMDLRVAKILAAEAVEGSKKLVRLMVEAGDKDGEGKSVSRQIVAGVGLAYETETLVGKEIVIVANLDPKTLAGIESQGMLLAASDSEGKPVILIPEQPVEPGTKIK